MTRCQGEMNLNKSMFLILGDRKSVSNYLFVKHELNIQWLLKITQNKAMETILAQCTKQMQAF